MTHGRGYKIKKRMRRIMKAGSKATKDFYIRNKRTNPNKPKENNGT